MLVTLGFLPAADKMSALPPSLEALLYLARYFNQNEILEIAMNQANPPHSILNNLGDMPVADFRQYAHQLVDWVADYFQNIEQHPVLPDIAPGEIREKPPTAPPFSGEALENILADVDRVIMPGMTHWNHPDFFAYFAITGSGPGILGEWLSGAFNINGMLWKTCPAATELEQVTLDWLRQMLGLPKNLMKKYSINSTSSFWKP